VLAEFGELAIDERPRRRGENDLAAMARGGDPGCPVELASGIALAGQLQHAGVQAHPHLDPAGGECLLTVSGSGQCLDRIGKGIEEGVSLRVDLDTAMSGEGAAKKTAVLHERPQVAILAELLDQRS
jgi:hypothetical protein